jgi:hypothetical protein
MRATTTNIRHLESARIIRKHVVGFECTRIEVNNPHEARAFSVAGYPWVFVQSLN